MLSLQSLARNGIKNENKGSLYVIKSCLEILYTDLTQRCKNMTSLARCDITISDLSQGRFQQYWPRNNNSFNQSQKCDVIKERPAIPPHGCFPFSLQICACCTQVSRCMHSLPQFVLLCHFLLCILHFWS